MANNPSRNSAVLVFPSDTAAAEPRFHPPCDLAVFSTPSLGAQATATIAAGAANVRHVATGASFSVGMTAIVTITTVGIHIIDGASGGTTYLWRGIMTVQGTTTGIVANTPVLNVPGSAATALTAEFSAGITNATELVTLTYHDIGNV